MKKHVLLLVLFLCCWGAIPASASSLIYSFTSYDVSAKDRNTGTTYGIGRIDFDSGVPVPTVLLSRDNKSHALGEFTRDGKRYIYDSKVQKPNEDTNYFDVYDASAGIDNPLAKDLSYTLTPNPIASADLKLAPDSKGYVYAIIGGTTLTRYDLLNWNSTVTRPLPSGYDVYSLVGLTDHETVLYLWASKRTKKADGSYASEKSDIFVYDRNTLTPLTTEPFHFVRTGLDSTSRRVDDQSKTSKTKGPELEVGRGLVAISATEVVLAVYDIDSADSPTSIVRINETANPTFGVISYDYIVKSTDIEKRTVDNESPIPDENGGFYFGCYSGDANAQGESMDSKVYHWNSAKTITKANLNGSERFRTTADLVIKKADHSQNTYAGSLVVFQEEGSGVDAGGAQQNHVIKPYIWDGNKGTMTEIPMTNTSSTTEPGEASGDVGVELEKPFTDGKDGIYFMMEMLVGSDDMDTLYHWNPSNNTRIVISSQMELEVETPPLDGNVGFYFVEATTITPDSHDQDTPVKFGMVSVDMKLQHCTGWEAAENVKTVSNLGTFVVPQSSFYDVSGDIITNYRTLLDYVESEHGFLQDTEHEMLFVNAGPVGGNSNLKVFTWNTTTQKDLSSTNIIKEFTDKDLGGDASIATALFFSESNGSVGGSGGGCNTGVEIFGLIGLGLTALITYRNKRKL